MEEWSRAGLEVTWRRVRCRARGRRDGLEERRLFNSLACIGRRERESSRLERRSLCRDGGEEGWG